MPLTIPKYIEVYTAAGQLAAVLSPQVDSLKDCYIDQHLNAECTLTFLLPMTSEKWDELNAECRIRAGSREFVILRPDAVDVVREGQKLWGKVMAAESWILLDKQYPTIPPGSTDLSVTILSSDPGEGGFSSGSAGSALYRLLAGSGWSVGTVDVTGTHDLETEKLSLLTNIQEVQKIWGGYLVWDSINKTVSLRAESTWQNYTGFQVRYAKNLKNITRTANYDLVTRLYPFGENDLDIASINGGIKYLENFSYTSNVYVGIYQNQDIYDPQELKDKGTEVLAKLCQPRYTYRVAMVDLRTLPEYSHEDFSLGDMVDVIDEGLETNVRARIMRYKYDIFQPWKCELEIGEPEERLAAKLADSFDVTRFVQDALRPNPATSNLLKGFINTFATTINSANGKLVWDDSTLQAIEIDGNGVETGKRVRITPGGVGISIDGGQTYVTAMTGEGILANTIIVNTLYALATDDGYTKLEASGLHVYDESLAERLIAGWWMDGVTKRFGLKADGGYIQIDGGLPDSQIGSVSAGKIQGGTIIASNSIYLGDTTFALEAANRRILIKDTQATPVERVILGKLGVGAQDYGITIKDAVGNTVVSASGLGLSVVGTDQLQNGAVTDIKVTNIDASKITTGMLVVDRIPTLGDSKIASAPTWNAKLDYYDVGDMAFEDLVEAAKLGTTIIEGGYIKSSLLTADNIVTGTLSANRIGAGTISATISIQGPTITGATIIGSTLATAEANGHKIVIENPTSLQNTIRFYGTGTHLIRSGGGSIVIDTDPDGLSYGSIRLRGRTGNYLDANTYVPNGVTLQAQSGGSIVATTGNADTVDNYHVSDLDARYAANLVYNSDSKLLKLFAKNGDLLAQVDISNS